jgi:hypothetical protein
MAMLNENEWNCINDLIFKIYSISDLKEMRYTFLNLIRILIPCDKLTFYLSDREHYMYDPMQIGLSPERTKAYADSLWKQDYKKWRILPTGRFIFWKFSSSIWHSGSTAICEQLCISSGTLKKHISNIYRKISVTSRAEFFNRIRNFN